MLKLLKEPYRDPIYDAPTDPVVIYNNEEKCWWMLYTQRRSGAHCVGVSHIHGTKIGVASSVDGEKWLYRGTLPNLDFEPGDNTFWAPEVIYEQGKYHMYVSYITGIPTDWNYPRHIVHYTADNMWDWKFESILDLASERVIDVCVYKVDDVHYRMWYKNENDNSYTYSSISTDLYHWENEGMSVDFNSHEGPNVFEFKGKKWLITDEWKGLGVYESEDFKTWKRNGVILKEGGERKWDNTIGHHADVVVLDGEAYIYYFTTPYADDPSIESTDDQNGFACVQVAKLDVRDGRLVCDR